MRSHVLLVAALVVGGSLALAGSSGAKRPSTLARAARDRKPPTVTLTAPTAGETVSGTILLKATATDNRGVTQVTFYVDGVLVATDNTGPTWARSWDSTTVADGPHTAFAKARDAAGNTGTSATVTFTVSNGAADTQPPTEPTSFAATSETETSITTTWTASTDNVGVAGYDLYVDGSKVGTTTSTSNTFSGLSCNTSYVLEVDAFDAAGNVSTPASLTQSTSACPAGGPCGTAAAPPAGGWQHVVWILFENKAYSQVIGSSNAPYINSVASECGLATNYFAESHPSLPNYIALTSGSTQGITDDADPSSHPLDVPSLFSQLGTGNWRSLEDSMPSNCDLSNSGDYAVRHNPAAYYVNIRTDCAAQDVPLGSTPDISAPFTFVTPNLCHDMHSSSCASTTATEVQAGDKWLSSFLPQLLASPEYTAGSTAIFLTWDEDDSSSSNHVPTIVISPSTAAGTTSATTFTHYSLLRTTEEMLGITTYLGGAATAASMGAAFDLGS